MTFAGVVFYYAELAIMTEEEESAGFTNDYDPPPYDSLPEAPPPPYSPSFLTTNRIFDIPEGPPDYFSLVSTRIQEARRDSTSHCTFFLKVMQTILFLFGVIILLIVLMSVPVAMLGVGAAYYGQCSIEPLIPIFMIIFGLCGVMKSIETLIKHLIMCFKCSCLKKWRQHPQLKYLFIVWRVLDVTFNLLSFGWFIAGSYWVFHVYGSLQESGFDRSLCHPVLYKFAFGMMISSYIIVGLTCCCVCGCGLCQNPVNGEGERRTARRGEEGEGRTRREGEGERRTAGRGGEGEEEGTNEIRNNSHNDHQFEMADLSTNSTANNNDSTNHSQSLGTAV